MLKNRKRTQLGQFLQKRFQERYLQPMGKDVRGGTGFAIAGSCCLTIEAIESFRNGWAPNETNAQKAFQGFFSHVTPTMPKDRIHCGRGGRRINCSCFYHGVRCGILHSGETTGGWRLRNEDEPWLHAEPPLLLLNAATLRKVVDKGVRAYTAKLAKARWDDRGRDPLWDAFERRMNWTIRHCNITQLGGEGQFP